MKPDPGYGQDGGSVVRAGMDRRGSLSRAPATNLGPGSLGQRGATKRWSTPGGIPSQALALQLAQPELLGQLPWRFPLLSQ